MSMELSRFYHCTQITIARLSAVIYYFLYSTRISHKVGTVPRRSNPAATSAM